MDSFIDSCITVYNLAITLLGLAPLLVLKNGKLKVLKWQHIQASILLTAYYISVYFVFQNGDNSYELPIKNSLVAKIIPTATAVLQIAAMTVTFISTHVFAKQRKQVLKSLAEIHQQYYSKLKLNYSYLPIIGIVLLLDNVFWGYSIISGVLTTGSNKMIRFLVIYLPKLVITVFAIDYTIMMSTLQSFFSKINEAVFTMQMRSLKSNIYPKNDREFQKYVTKITDQHKTLTKTGKTLNVIYSFQLLLSIALLYGLILVDTYAGVYLFLSVGIKTGKDFLGFMLTAIMLFFHTFLLLSLVEISSKVWNEVSSTVFIYRFPLKFRLSRYIAIEHQFKSDT